jgi:hypothetical protein
MSSSVVETRDGRSRGLLHSEVARVLPLDLTVILHDHLFKRSRSSRSEFDCFQLQQLPEAGVAMRRALQAAAWVAAIVAVLGACSSTGRSSATATAFVPSRTSITLETQTSVATTKTITTNSSTEASTTNSSSATSTSASSSATSTTNSSTTAVAQTTLIEEAQVRAAYLAAYDDYWVCLRDPTACDPTTLTASSGPARATLTDAVNKLRSSDLKVGPDDVGYVVIDSVTFDSSLQSATVKSCWWDTGVVYGPPAKVGGDAIVVNNLQVTSRFDSTLVLESGVWRISREVRTGRAEGVNQCPPKGS